MKVEKRAEAKSLTDLMHTHKSLIVLNCPACQFRLKAEYLHEELVQMLRRVYREGAGRYYQEIGALIAKAEVKS